MRTALLLVAGLLLGALSLARAENPFYDDSPEPLLGRTFGSSVQNAARPAYQLAEGLSDGVFNFLRSHLIGNMLPYRLNRHLKEAPKSDSYSRFEENLSRKQNRYLRRLENGYAAANAASAQHRRESLETWRSWALEEQRGVLIDAFADTLVERYQLEVFGKDSGRDAQNPAHWDAGVLAASTIFGGAYVFLNGMHARGRLADFAFALDLRPGQKLQKALQSGGALDRFASVELRYRDIPLAAVADLGLSDGDLLASRYGLRYSLRY